MYQAFLTFLLHLASGIIQHLSLFLPVARKKTTLGAFISYSLAFSSTKKIELFNNFIIYTIYNYV